jgi:hypothetical protein
MNFSRYISLIKRGFGLTLVVTTHLLFLTWLITLTMYCVNHVVGG